MEFVNQTVIGKKELTALARGARRSVRKKRGVIVRIVGLAVILLNVLFCAASIKAGDSRWWVNGALALFLLVIIFGEDQLNGRVSAKYLLPDAQKVTTSFGPEGYTSATASSESRFTYDQIQAVCETRDCFLFYLNRNLGQIYDKNGFTKGTAMAFRDFISRKTGLQVKNI
ncbi:MAG: YcxB family protein [Oscillospiraceae bacterium]|nr:YcxB family protein [Oscillospiraceae bacterium]